MLDLRLDECLAIRDHEEAETEGVPSVTGIYSQVHNNPHIYSVDHRSHIYFSGTS